MVTKFNEGEIYNMDISWYDRFVEEFEFNLRETCDSVSDLIDEGLIEFNFNRSNKHPSIDLILLDEDEDLITVITICFDLYNHEIYTSIPKDGLIKELRLIFENPSELFDHLHIVIHEFIDNEGEEEEAI